MNTISFSKLIVCLLAIVVTGNSFAQKRDQNSKKYHLDSLLVRVAEIEIYPEYLDQYLTVLKEESEASVRLETGVICIYPMYQKENPNQIRLLEIYASKEAYELHVQTAHFKHYKQATSKMVKSLRLVDMEAIDRESIPMIFRKLN